jgi:hypothetical protein
MNDKINRRTFLTQASCGLGAFAVNSTVTPLLSASCAKPIAGRRKKLIATTDYNCNIGKWNTFFTRSQLDDMHKYLASIGVTRHQWIVDTFWNLYETYPYGMDLLREVVDSAHKHGIELVAKIKPFEAGGFSEPLPHTMPVPEGAALKDMRGIYPVIIPFAAKNPNMSLKRRPGTYDKGGAISAIRLVKGNDAPTRLKQEYLSIYTSDKNNGFIPYNGPVSFRETVEWRPCFPKSKQCRVLHLDGLHFPEHHTYFIIRCSLSGNKGGFTNENGSIIELEDIHGNKIPYTLGTGPVPFRVRQDDSESIQTGRYFLRPEVKSELRDQSKMQAHYQDFYNFDVRRKITEPYTLDSSGYIAVACGKPEYMTGILHPVYPEVRKHWLDLVRFCLDRGVDGINFRSTTHTQSSEFWEYGFNEPVIGEAGGRTDYAAIRHVNGNAYTRFLNEARELIKSYGKSITIQLYAQMLMPDDRETALNWMPPNFEWQWEKWVMEIADDLEFRGAWTLRPWNLRQVVDAFSAVTMAANKPFYFEGKMQEIRDAGFDGPFHYTKGELGMVRDHPGLNGFSLYETNHFTKVNDAGNIEGSRGLAKMLQEFSWLNNTSKFKK